MTGIATPPQLLLISWLYAFSCSNPLLPKPLLEPLLKYLVGIAGSASDRKHRGGKRVIGICLSAP
jgi:hypothetical protein